MAKLSVSNVVRQRISRDIMDGVLKPGDVLPSEASLGADLGAGRGSIREALAVLEREGFIEVRQGKGRVVSQLRPPLVERPITNFHSVSNLLTEAGYETQCLVLSSTSGRATSSEVKALALTSGARILRLERVRILGASPIVWMRESIPIKLLGSGFEEMDWSGSLVEALSRRGHHPVASRAKISAVIVPRDLQSALPGDRGLDTRPWAEITETNLDQHGVPCLYSKVYLEGSLFSFTFIRREES